MIGTGGRRSVSATPALSVAILAASALAYELLLMRLFSVIQWHHFAYMIISLALLGYGASGTLLTLARARLTERFEGAYIVSTLLFGVSAVGCFLLAQSLTFNPEELLWDPLQMVRLAAGYLLLSLPFLFAATAIGLALMQCTDRIAHLYACDLVGAGLGGLAMFGALYLAAPITALGWVGASGALAAAVGALELRHARPLTLLLSVLAASALVAVGYSARPVISPYKGLTQQLRIDGSRILAERNSPLGTVTAVANAKVPLRHAPGLSLNAASEPPAQIGLFTDADALSVITRDDGDRTALAHLDGLTSALPYHLSAPQRVLILGAGGGGGVLQARYHDVPQVDAVELNRQIVDLVSETFADFSGGLYTQSGTTVHVVDARGFAATTDETYDLVQLSLLDSFGASTAGLHAVGEDYLHTVEALRSYYARLRPEGYLAITRWINLPPRDLLKLFATAVDALRESGVTDPARRLLFVRGWQTGTLLVKNGPLSPEEIEAARLFCEARSFDVAYYPGMPEQEANRFNLLSEPAFYRAATALLGPESERFRSTYKFDITPATDDRPYFGHFLKWRSMPEILSLRGRGGASLVEWGFVTLLATLVQAIAASAVLILLPLRQARRGERSEAVRLGPVLIYFAAIGLAFLFLEIALIQKFVLYLHHPVLAVALVLTVMLVSAGVGSAASARLSGRFGARRMVTAATAGIALLGLSCIVGLDPLFSVSAGLSWALKGTLTALLIAPLGICMGVPFPIGLSRLQAAAPNTVPWAWGINGCASVVSAVLATLLAMSVGFSGVAVTALALYAIAALTFVRFPIPAL